MPPAPAAQVPGDLPSLIQGGSSSAPTAPASPAEPVATPAAPPPALAEQESPPAPVAVDEASKPKPVPVSVRLDILPWGEVWINGAARGVSPPVKELKLLPGKYQVVVRNADLPPLRMTLDVKAGRPAVISHTFK